MRINIFNTICKNLIIINLVSFLNTAFADDTIHLFPLENYGQNVDNFFDPNSSDNNTSLIKEDIIIQKTANYKEHLFGKLSPWSEEFVTKILNVPAPNDLQNIELLLFNKYRNNCDTSLPVSFGENFKPYSCEWFDKKIFDNMDLNQFNFPIPFNKNRKAIATSNILARAFPTNDPIFSNYKIAGEGYPFDNLQVSSIWLGSPLYILGKTKNELWSLVITSSGYIAWVPSEKIAFVDDDFISQYVNYVVNNGLRVITHTEINIKSEKDNIVLTSVYIGSIFPSNNSSTNKIVVPMRKTNGFAKLVSALVEEGYASIFPLSPTPQNFASIFKELVGRPYGWGGYNFYNDCSQELQSIFTVFGIWLPRNSADQINAGSILDLSNESTTERTNRLSSDAHKLVTLVYIKGHIMLYVGNYYYFGNLVPTIYNNIWGLRPSDNSYRAIIGQAAFFPLFASFLYPEDKNLISLIDSEYRPIFKLSFLDLLPKENSLELFKSSDNSSENINLKKMILPEFFL